VFALRLLTSSTSSRFGRDFVEFEINNAGSVRYVNKSTYHGADMIRKGFKVSSLVVAKIKDMVRESGILSVNDEKWPKPGPNDGAQEIEIVLDGKYLWLETCALVSRNDTMKSSDPEGLSKLHLLSEDIQEILLAFTNFRFKSSPFG